MKSQIKDIVIGIFAVIGFTAIVMGFNNPAEPQQVTSTVPESHEWELVMSVTSTDAYIYNKKTGETWGMRRQEIGDKWAKIQQIK